MKLCREYQWHYLLTHKAGRQKNVEEGLEWIKGGDALYEKGLCKEKGEGFYANHVEEVVGKKEVMNVLEYKYEREDKEGKKQSVRFEWISSLEITRRKLEEMEDRKRRI